MSCKPVKLPSQVILYTDVTCLSVFHAREGGGGGGGAVILVRGTGVRASILKPTQFIYLAFEKTDPFIYLIIQNVDLLPFDFLYPFFAGYYTNITVNSCNTKRISSLEKSLSEKYVHIPGCQKIGSFHTGIQKNRAIHILFVEKTGPIIYLVVLKKGAIRHAHPYYAIYRKLPTPPPPPPTHRLPREFMCRALFYQVSCNIILAGNYYPLVTSLLSVQLQL